MVSGTVFRVVSRGAGVVDGAFGMLRLLLVVLGDSLRSQPRAVSSPARIIPTVARVMGLPFRGRLGPTPSLAFTLPTQREAWVNRACRPGGVPAGHERGFCGGPFSPQHRAA